MTLAVIKKSYPIRQSIDAHKYPCVTVTTLELSTTAGMTVPSYCRVDRHIRVPIPITVPSRPDIACQKPLPVQYHVYLLHPRQTILPSTRGICAYSMFLHDLDKSVLFGEYPSLPIGDSISGALGHVFTS